jgi:hypothetical protein
MVDDFAHRLHAPEPERYQSAATRIAASLERYDDRAAAVAKPPGHGAPHLSRANDPYRYVSHVSLHARDDPDFPPAPGLRNNAGNEDFNCLEGSFNPKPGLVRVTSHGTVALGGVVKPR